MSDIPNRSVLFLSGIDFKKKSIQVIIKTPEAYIQNGWQVDYVVARDTSKFGSYFYEDIVDPKGVNVVRFEKPLSNFKNRIKYKLIRNLISKISGYLTAYYIFKNAKRLLDNKKYDVIYAYENKGVMALWLLKLNNLTSNSLIVTRFQGTWLYKFIKERSYIRLLTNLDAILAMKTNADLILMTDDGTEGDKAFEYLNKKNKNKFIFMANGVDVPELDLEILTKLKVELELREDEIIFLSVSRLTSWKRVDRCIRLIYKIKVLAPELNIRYLVVGDGEKTGELKILTEELGLTNEVSFLGSVNNELVKYYMSLADFFLSFYELSNVGNPLLEAMRSNLFTITLNNGDTGKWIDSSVNGLIYEEATLDFEIIANDILKFVNDKSSYNEITKNIANLNKGRLLTWKDRFNKEISLINNLLSRKRNS